jgi:sigma-B regulation protein RsbU (phosphoserine phosphatase)
MARVGGDFYTYIPLNEDNIGILISDIVGHGVPAALVTAMMKAIIDISGNFIDSPQYLMTFLNEKLLQVQNGERFLTAFYGIYNRRTGYLTYTRCGHPYPFIIRGEELIEVKGNRGNPVLGLFHESAFHEDFIHLVPGDKILFYTDGLIEALSPEGQPFEEHLEKVLKVNSHLPIEKLIDRVYYYLLLHCEKDMFEDDVCMVGMELEI